MAPSSSPPPPSPQRPLPQPVEESQRSNRSSSAASAQECRSGGPSDTPTSPSKLRRALPQPVESSSKSSKKGVAKANRTSDTSRDPIGVTSSAARTLPQPIEALATSNAQISRPRQFAPQMIETSRRSRRNTRSDSDTTPLVSPIPADSLNESLHSAQHLSTSLQPTASDASPFVSTETHPPAPESRFSSAKLTERAGRRHSFRVPTLPVIPSTTESNDSSASSADADSSPERRRRTEAVNRASQARESQDETTSTYLLSLAAHAAEKQLKEQVMAAYPNENLHEPVDHYAGDRDSEDDSGVEPGVRQLSMSADGPVKPQSSRKSLSRQRRDSESEGDGGGLAELRKHGDKLEQQERGAWEAQSKCAITFSNIGASDPNAEFRQRAAAAAAIQPPAAGPPAKNWHAPNELKSMAKAASPPMAGENLLFPRCQSPSNTRLDVHQYPGHSRLSGEESRQQSGLWTPKGGTTRDNSQSGLWMGVNAASAQGHLAAPRFIETGLITPAVERGDPFSEASSVIPSRRSSYVPASSLPPSPPSSQEEDGSKKHIIKKPRITTTESLTELEEELNDAFVTQVYNYLSLGYPSLARPYDEELAKISNKEVEILRKDDGSGNSKGYIGAPEGTGIDMRGCREGACERWLALKYYIHEWGRQQALAKGIGGLGWDKAEMVNDSGGWGARARKGSWAI